LQRQHLAVLQPDAVFHERYRVVRALKVGGMGAIYEVLDGTTNARRALKVMLPGAVSDPELRARFALEARVTGDVESEHVVRVSDAGIDEGSDTPFIVMDLLRGEDLGQALAERGALSPAEVVRLLWQAGMALDKTHAAGIVHRDLKPENLFVTRRDDGSACVKVLDFGIAKVIPRTPSAEQTTQAVGTPLYMAPEQIWSARNISPRADLYALAHVAYALLAGEAYWTEEQAASTSAFMLFNTIAAGPVEKPVARAARRGVALPAAFDGWFGKAAAIAPDDRFERAGEAVAALGRALGVELPAPPSARAVTGERQRGRALAVAALAGVMTTSPDVDPTATTVPSAALRLRRWIIGAAILGAAALIAAATYGALAAGPAPHDRAAPGAAGPR
jgi:serine/threonine-protein kinase